MTKKNTEALFAIILAGGAGTRFWPASRAKRPKQVLPLSGGAPMIRETAERILPVLGEGRDAWSNVLVATGTHLSAITAHLLPEIAKEQFLAEPTPRNTAPCIAWAAHVIARKTPDAVVMVLPSDHHIADVPEFQSTLRVAVESAKAGLITTIGIRPTRPETGFGYIEVAGLANAKKVQKGVKFIEKPNYELAKLYVESGRYLWNAGMFFFRAKDMVAAVEKYLPEMAAALRLLDEAASRGEEETVIKTVFPQLQSISIDHGVMDHLPELNVIPGNFGWSDVGSFEASWELSLKDEKGNVAPEGSILLDAISNYVLQLNQSDGASTSAETSVEGAPGNAINVTSAGAGIHAAQTAPRPKRIIALLGVDDLVVIETEDALLITKRARTQDVKLIVEELKKRGLAHLV